MKNLNEVYLAMGTEMQSIKVNLETKKIETLITKEKIEEITGKDRFNFRISCADFRDSTYILIGTSQGVIAVNKYDEDDILFFNIDDEYKVENGIVRSMVVLGSHLYIGYHNYGKGGFLLRWDTNFISSKAEMIFSGQPENLSIEGFNIHFNSREKVYTFNVVSRKLSLDYSHDKRILALDFFADEIFAADYCGRMVRIKGGKKMLSKKETLCYVSAIQVVPSKNEILVSEARGFFKVHDMNTFELIKRAPESNILDLDYDNYRSNSALYVEDQDCIVFTMGNHVAKVNYSDIYNLEHDIKTRTLIEDMPDASFVEISMKPSDFTLA